MGLLGFAKICMAQNKFEYGFKTSIWPLKKGLLKIYCLSCSKLFSYKNPHNKEQSTCILLKSDRIQQHFDFFQCLYYKLINQHTNIRLDFDDPIIVLYRPIFLVQTNFEVHSHNIKNHIKVSCFQKKKSLNFEVCLLEEILGPSRLLINAV